MSIAYLTRDPFARSTLVREVVRSVVTLCDWCGQSRRSGALFHYGTLRDDCGTPDWHRGAFCSKECHDSYHS